MPTDKTVDFGETLTDAEIFDNATTPEPAAPEPAATPPEPAPEAPEPVETTGGRLKDPVTGKFVAKEAKPDEIDQRREAAVEIMAGEKEVAEPEVDAEPQMPASVPSWRLAEEAQRRREAEAQNYAAQQQLRQMQIQMAQFQEQMQRQQEPIDPVSNPEMYQHQLQQFVQKEVSGIRLESNLQIAQMRHGEKFDRAYEAFVENSYGGDKASYDYVMNSPNPGEAIVRWHSDREVRKQVGDDPAAYVQAEIERRMADPAFQAEVIKRYQAQNGSAPSNQQVKLPPSLSRSPSAAPAAEGNIDVSDAALFEYATAKR